MDPKDTFLSPHRYSVSPAPSNLPVHPRAVPSFPAPPTVPRAVSLSASRLNVPHPTDHMAVNRLLSGNWDITEIYGRLYMNCQAALNEKDGIITRLCSEITSLKLDRDRTERCQRESAN